MKRSLPLLFPVLLLAAMQLGSTSDLLAGGEVNLLAGTKWFSGEVEDADSVSATIGLLTSFGMDGWPVWLAFDVTHSEQLDFEFLTMRNTYDSTEFHLGVRKVWSKPRWRLSVGGGPAVNCVESEYSISWTQRTTENAWGAGWWLNGRGSLVFGHFQVGLDARISRAKVEAKTADAPAGEKIESGGEIVGLFVGGTW